MKIKTRIMSLALAAMLPSLNALADEAWQPVRESDVRAWAERGSLWCMNPHDAGGCDMLAVWRSVPSGGFEFVAAETLGRDGSLFTVTQPFTIEGDRQCYTVDPAAVRFGTIGNPPAEALADARRRWAIGLADERGSTFCMAFLREPGTGLVRRRQWRDGVARDNRVAEVWRVELQGVPARGGSLRAGATP